MSQVGFFVFIRESNHFWHQNAKMIDNVQSCSAYKTATSLFVSVSQHVDECWIYTFPNWLNHQTTNPIPTPYLEPLGATWWLTPPEKSSLWTESITEFREGGNKGWKEKIREVIRRANWQSVKLLQIPNDWAARQERHVLFKNMSNDFQALKKQLVKMYSWVEKKKLVEGWSAQFFRSINPFKWTETLFDEGSTQTKFVVEVSFGSLQF